uniref:Uncharacterized protein n=1 Tax=Oryza rufipogon TaxID=4529 RepID=A0A0E0MSU2_ORYRU
MAWDVIVPLQRFSCMRAKRALKLAGHDREQQTGSILPGWIPSMADACMSKHESDHHKRRDDGATLTTQTLTTHAHSPL